MQPPRQIPQEGSPMPPLDEVLRWPDELRTQEVDQQRAAIEQELSELEARAAALRQQLASEDTLFPSSDSKLDPETARLAAEMTTEREQTAKTNILKQLGWLGLSDGEVTSAEYILHVDHDLAGGYDEQHRATVFQKAGMFLITHEVSYANSVGAERGYLQPHGTQLLMHAQQDRPLKAKKIGPFNLRASRSSRWTYEEDKVQEVVRAVATNQLVDQALSILSSGDLQPTTRANGGIDPWQLKIERVIPTGSMTSVHLVAVYNKPNSQTDPLELSSIHLQHRLADEVQEAYRIDSRSLEIRATMHIDDGIAPQKMLEKSRLLLKVAVDALAKDGPER